MDLVDLNGMWPSLKDIGKGIKNAAVKLWDSSNNILGLDLGRTLYNETVRDEILSFVKMQIANGVSSVNSEILSFIISQEIANKTKNGCGE